MFGGYHLETTSIPKEMVSKIQDKECIKYYANGFMESGEDENVSACMKFIDTMILGLGYYL